MTNHFQTREVLSKIINSDLIDLIKLPYANESKKMTTHQYELFDNSTKKFVLHFKKDIQNINNGNLSIQKFKRKVGSANFALFAQTANLCTNDSNNEERSSQNIANITYDFNDILYPDKSIYNKIGNEILDKMLTPSNRRMFLEKTKEIASMDIINIGKMLEYKLQNKPKEILNHETR